MSDLIRIDRICKSYGDFALSDVSLAVPRGCIVGFVGANGAGKTTTIRAAFGLTEPDSGDVTLFGEPFLTAKAAAQRRLKARVGVVLDTCPFVGVSVRDAGAIMRAAYPSWDQPYFERMLREFGLDPKKPVEKLSRGMGMKLQMACALAHRPDLLILDEATAGLDPLARDEALGLLRDFVADDNRGILMSSHITSDLDKIADEVVCIHEGRVIFDLEKDEICDRMGIARCRAADVDAALADDACVPAGGTPHVLRHAYGADVCVADRFAFAKRHPSIPCDRMTIDDYLHFVLEGGPR